MNYPTPTQRAAARGFAALADRVAVRVAADRGVSKKDALEVIEAFGDELFETIRLKRRVYWPRRGTFRVTRRKARTIANPHTGERMRLPRMRGIAFRAAKHQKDLLNGI